MTDQIITSWDNGNSSVNMLVTLVIVAIILVAGYFFYTGTFGNISPNTGNKLQVDVKLPDPKLPVAPSPDTTK